MPGNRKLATDLARQAKIRAQVRERRAAKSHKPVPEPALEDDALEEEEEEETPAATGPIARVLPGLEERVEAAVLAVEIWKSIRKTPEYTALYEATRAIALADNPPQDNGTPATRKTLLRIRQVGAELVKHNAQIDRDRVVQEVVARHGAPPRLRDAVRAALEERLEDALTRDRADGAVRRTAFLAEYTYNLRQMELGG